MTSFCRDCFNIKLAKFAIKAQSITDNDQHVTKPTTSITRCYAQRSTSTIRLFAMTKKTVGGFVYVRYLPIDIDTVALRGIEQE